jgi:glycosyltransferase involved in cell wall biosynthesis
VIRAAMHRPGVDTVVTQSSKPDASGIRVSVVVPVLNGMRYLPRTAPSLLAAARHAGDVEITYVDNGSTDGTLDYLGSLASDGVVVRRFETKSIGAMRNFGARTALGRYLSFLDADCEIPTDYFSTAVGVLETTHASATGCETHAPDSPHWIEATWHDLHYVGRTRDVHYLNSANFFVRKAVFDEIGGFREDLTTGEDSEIGQRILKAGFRIREDVRVKAVHFGNPKSIGEFYRRTVWHGLGMLGNVSRQRLNRPIVMTAVHLAASAFGVILLAATTWPMLTRIGALVGLQLLVPAVTVAHRARQTRRLPRIVPALLLYWLYYWARAQALLIVLTGRARRYRK